MRIGGLIAALAAGVASVVAATAAAGGNGVDIRRVDFAHYPMVKVTVLAPQGVRPSVRENGSPVTHAVTTNVGYGNAILLAIDNSRSMAGRPLSQAGAAARLFVDRTDNKIGLLSFGSDKLMISKFTWTKAELYQPLATLRPDQNVGTVLYDAIGMGIGRLVQSSGSRVLVVLSDGNDLGSKLTLEEVVQRAQRAGVVVYAVAAGQADRSALGVLARSTGGRLFDVASASKLPAAYASIANELGRVWQVSYPTEARRGDNLQVTVSAGRRSATVPEVVPGSVGTADALLPHFLLSNPIGAALVALLAGAALATAALIAIRRPEPERVRGIVDAQLARASLPGRGQRRKKNRLRTQLAQLFDRTEDSFGSLRASHWLSRNLERAGTDIRPAQVLYAGVVAAFALGLVASFAGAASALILVLMAVAFIAPFVVIRVQAERRSRAFDSQLPDMLAALAAALRVGHGLRQALQGIAQDGGPPISEEVSRVLAEERLGRPLGEAFVAMCDRLGSPELEYVSTAVTVQTQVGGSMATLFESVSETVRERQRHARKVRALTSLGRTSAIVLVSLPIAVAAFLTAFSYDYIAPLWETGTGHLLVGMSLVSMTIGGYVLSRIASVDG